MIDDLLPTRKGCLLYMRSASRVEFWPALLEKAYAKVRGAHKIYALSCNSHEIYALSCNLVK